MDEFFEQALQEETQVEQPVEINEDVSVEQPVESETTPDTPVDTTQDAQSIETPTVDTPQPNTGKVILPEVGEFSVDEIKEWQYIYNQQLKNAQAKQQLPIPNQVPLSPVEQRLVELEQRLADKELEDTLATLKQKYADFDETKVLKTAYEKGLTDLEFVYKATRAEKQVDVESIKEQLRAEILAELTANKAETSTIISSNNAPVQSEKVELAPHELAIAQEFGLTPEEYLQYR